MNKIIKIIVIIVGGIFVALGFLFIAEKVTGIDFLGSLKTTLSNSAAKSPEENDTTPLEVEMDTNERVVLQSVLSTLVKSNKDISVEREDKFNLIFNTELDGIKYYVVEIKNIGVGPAQIPITFKDKSGQTETITIPVTRENYPLPFGINSIKGWEGSTYVINGDDLLTQLDKKHRLIDDYAPIDLVDLNKDKQLFTNSENIFLRAEAADYLALMLNNLKKETDKNVVIASGYRSNINQFKQYVSWVQQLGQTKADEVSSRPGHSEHTLGTSVDFMSQDSGFNFTNEFDNTVAGKWLKENAYKYGFVQSYRDEYSELTGIGYEAWHYRYIGVENAKELKESDLQLIEFLENKNK